MAWLSWLQNMSLWREYKYIGVDGELGERPVRLVGCTAWKWPNKILLSLFVRPPAARSHFFEMWNRGDTHNKLLQQRARSATCARAPRCDGAGLWRPAAEQPQAGRPLSRWIVQPGCRRKPLESRERGKRVLAEVVDWPLVARLPFLANPLNSSQLSQAPSWHHHQNRILRACQRHRSPTTTERQLSPQLSVVLFV